MARKGAVQGAKGFAKGYLAVEGVKNVYGGVDAGIDYLSGDDPVEAWDYGFRAPGKTQNYMQSGFGAENAYIDEKFGRWGRTAVNIIPAGNQVVGWFSGSNEAFKDNVMQKALDDGLSEDEATGLANYLARQRNANQAGEAVGVLAANVKSEQIGRLGFKNLDDFSTPGRSSFAATFPAGAYEGGAVYAAEVSGSSRDPNARDLAAASIAGGITAGTISSVINKGQTGTLFGGRNVEGSKAVGWITEKGGYWADWNEKLGDTIADMIYPDTKNIRLSSVKTLNSPLSFSKDTSINLGSTPLSSNTKTVSNLKTVDFTKAVPIGDSQTLINAQSKTQASDMASTLTDSKSITDTLSDSRAQSNPFVTDRTSTLTDTTTIVETRANANPQAQAQTNPIVRAQARAQAQAQTNPMTSTFSGFLPPPYGRVRLPQGRGGGSGRGINEFVVQNKVQDYAGAFFGKKQQPQTDKGYQKAQGAVDRLFGANIASGRSFRSNFGDVETKPKKKKK